MGERLHACSLHEVRARMRIGGDGAEISHALSGARRVREEIEREREDAREVPSPAKAARPHAEGSARI